MSRWDPTTCRFAYGGGRESRIIVHANTRALGSQCRGNPGEVLAGKYRVERVIGSGEMGIVVAARHVQLGFLTAIKFMHPEARPLHARERFLREARAAGRLRGEHTVRVTDFGTLEGGTPYIVMELLEGSDLGAVLQTRGSLPVAEAVAYVLDACAAMAEAHRAGIVHRDLTPKNLFLTRRPNGTQLVKVLDFGLSKLIGSKDDEHGSRGSPGFTSPEQIRDFKQADARSDIYALGSVLYYLLAKDYPFAATSARDRFEKTLDEPPCSLRERRPDVPAALEAVVLRCLQKHPDARYSNVKELMAALRAAMECSSRVIRAPRARPRAWVYVMGLAAAIAAISFGARLARGPHSPSQLAPMTTPHTTPR